MKTYMIPPWKHTAVETIKCLPILGNQYHFPQNQAKSLITINLSEQRLNMSLWFAHNYNFLHKTWFIILCNYQGHVKTELSPVISSFQQQDYKAIKHLNLQQVNSSRTQREMHNTHSELPLWSLSTMKEVVTCKCLLCVPLLYTENKTYIHILHTT